MIQYFGTKIIDLKGKTLGILMLAEMVIIAIFDLGVVLHGDGPTGFISESFAPPNVFVKGLEPTSVFVVTAFMGFENIAIYSDEARGLGRTIPAATYVAVVVILAFFAVSSWQLISAYGVHAVVGAATKDPGNMWYSMATRLIGKLSADVMSVLMLAGLFAVLLSFHNAISRYSYSIGREGILPRRLAILHPAHQTPSAASIARTVYGMVVLLLCGFFGLDAMNVVVPLTAAPASIGIVAVQCFTSLAVIGFFSREQPHTNLWQRAIAPILSFTGLSWVLYLVVENMAFLMGGETTANRIILDGMLATAMFGLGLALWFRKRSPSLYWNLARAFPQV
ncbi:TPA: APC family permease [Burkholderia cepacia]|nr:APC family permease [Burkholderia cepacia]